MPSKNLSQHRLMAMVAHDPAAAKRLGIPQSVGKEFVKADVGRKFKEGGSMKESKAMMGKEVAFMKKKGAPKSMVKHEEAEMATMKKGGMAKFAMGGFAKVAGTKVTAGGKRPHGEHTVQQKGHTKAKMPKMAGSTTGMRRGGKC